MALHKQLRLKEWREGVSINRAADLLCPEAVDLYEREAFTLGSGDPVTIGPSKRAYAAAREIMETIEELLHAGELVLETLHPPDDPQGKYVQVSMDVLKAKGLRAFWNPRKLVIIDEESYFRLRRPVDNRPGKVSAERKALEWMESLVGKGPQDRPKSAYRAEAQKNFPGLTQRGFDNRVWPQATRDNENWTKPGPKLKKPKH